MTLRRSSRFGTYDLVEILGTGGMREVDRATDVNRAGEPDLNHVVRIPIT